MTAFPVCGCDACAETAEGEAERLKSTADDLTAGRFREAVVIPAVGAARMESEFWNSTAVHSIQKFQLGRNHARQLLAASSRSSYEWKPWPQRV